MTRKIRKGYGLGLGILLRFRLTLGLGLGLGLGLKLGLCVGHLLVHPFHIILFFRMWAIV